MENRMVMLVQPLPGLRLLAEEKTEEGSIIAFRKDGDECLYVAGTDENKGMVWIPVSEFSVDPEAVTPPDFFEEPPPGGESEPTAESEEQPVSEKPSRSGPMGRLRRRPEIGGGGGQ